jgi:HAD superfamily hydrolase (TIGR01490 family)
LKLALFDLDHTLLAGDSDALWCAFLLRLGVLDRSAFEPRNEAMAIAYHAGSVGAHEFCEFYVSTLAGRTPAEWDPLRQAFLRDEIVPRIPPAARALIETHRAAGDLLVLTTATNRFITEPTAAHLGLEHLIATECEVGADGRFSGHTRDTLNIREGKVARLHTWLAARGQSLTDFDSMAYSDSINDLPLLQAATRAAVVDPDEQLAAEARTHGWSIVSLHR